MEKLKELCSSLLLIATLGWVLLHLILIKKHGVVAIREGNKLILNIELVFISLLILLGIERFVKDTKEE